MSYHKPPDTRRPPGPIELAQWADDLLSLIDVHVPVYGNPDPDSAGYARAFADLRRSGVYKLLRGAIAEIDVARRSGGAWVFSHPQRRAGVGGIRAKNEIVLAKTRH